MTNIERKIRELLPKYGHYIPTVALLWGLFWDTLTLRRPDSIFENATVVGYLALSAGAIIFLNLRRARRGTDPSLILLAFMQFAFGNLTSALIILYAKSGTFVGSVMFFAVFGALLVGNEFVRDRYSKIHVHIAVWYVLLIAYSIVVVPILIGSMGDMVFLVSMLASLAIVSAFIGALYAIASKELAKRLYHIAGSVVAIAVLMTALYFTGAIPPAPLMLRHIGIYHSITRTPEGDYRGTFEAPRWYEFFSDTARVYTRTPGGKMYCASSVFAPVRLETAIYHRWEAYDPVQQKWIEAARIPFNIRGGRDSGYRGYTELTIQQAGAWRCNVETGRGALIGRMTFDVVETPTIPQLSETVF